MVLVGQAALRSPAFSERLSALLTELQARGCTVWLEGMAVRFDVPESQLPWVQAGGVGELLGRYADVVLWLPEELPSSFEGVGGLHSVLPPALAQTRSNPTPVPGPRALGRWLKPRQKRVPDASRVQK